MIRTELYCVTKNFYPLIFILGDNSYKKYSRSKNFEALADDMVIDPKRRVFILEEDSIVDTSNDSLVEENMLDVGLKHSLRIEQITANPSKFEKIELGSEPLRKRVGIDDTLRESQLKASILTHSAKFNFKNQEKLRNSSLVKESAIGTNSPVLKSRHFRSTANQDENSLKFGEPSPRGARTQRSPDQYTKHKFDKDVKTQVIKLQKSKVVRIDKEKYFNMMEQEDDQEDSLSDHLKKKRKNSESFDIDVDNTTVSSDEYSEYKIDLDEEGNDRNMNFRHFVN